MLTSTIDGLVARFGLAGETIGEVAGGAVLKHSKDFNLTREAVLGSALSPTTPAYDIGQACATGLETVVSLTNKINAGQIESGIASGVDSASDAPIVVGDSLREILLELSRAKTLTPADTRGGTFTISNHGVSGSLLATPIIIKQVSIEK